MVLLDPFGESENSMTFSNKKEGENDFSVKRSHSTRQGLNLKTGITVPVTGSVSSVSYVSSSFILLLTFSLK